MYEKVACPEKDELRDAYAALKCAESIFHAIEQLANATANNDTMRELARVGFKQTANAAKEAEWVLHQYESSHE
jgi:hypothetical protein